MIGVHIGQPCDALHVDLFSSIYHELNNEKMTSPKDTDFYFLIMNN